MIRPPHVTVINFLLQRLVVDVSEEACSKDNSAQERRRGEQNSLSGGRSKWESRESARPALREAAGEWDQSGCVSSEMCREHVLFD